ncbi:MAG: DUF6569 family protein [Bacteroidota bacterium]
MRYTALLSLLFLFFACQPTESETPNANKDVSIDTEAGPAWEKDQLRLIPLRATEDFVTQNAAVAQYEVLADALQNERFRISEKKPFGRFDDAQAVNTLTVQNKTEAAIFLMAGDIVQGGNQDRVIGEDRVIAARSIEDVPVFCVERGRWNYQGDQALNESDKKVFAFRGYYNVASRQVRQSVASGSQQSVWQEVSELTIQHDTQSSTSAYAGLEGNDEFVRQRTDYERFFADKLKDNEDIIGFIALSGDQILGADVFGHPELLNKQFPALLSSYATDAISLGNDQSLNKRSLDAFTRQLERTIAEGSERVPFVHLAELP